MSEERGKTKKIMTQNQVSLESIRFWDPNIEIDYIEVMRHLELE